MGELMDRRKILVALVVTPAMVTSAVALEAAGGVRELDASPEIAGRKILHVRAGSDDWDPTEEELKEISDLFQRAIMDPTGEEMAVVTTRHDIVTEIIQL